MEESSYRTCLTILHAEEMMGTDGHFQSQLYDGKTDECYEDVYI